MQMKEQKKTLAGKDVMRQRNLRVTAFDCDTFLFSSLRHYVETAAHNSFCVRFLAAASLQGLVQEGTMTSLCIAMTEEQHKSMVVDCTGAQLQLHNAGEITVVNTPVFLRAAETPWF